ncbi:hypothetical protein BC835DRAFT_1372938 [Cytidiella melzeri]|nr:hypothetical protein BC835DRAFT_1372938 [Cytidiella melzeri]
MSTQAQSHPHHPPFPLGGSVCFLPNCAFLVMPACPTCGNKSTEEVSVPVTSSTLIANIPASVESSENQVITKASTYDRNAAPTQAITERTKLHIAGGSTPGFTPQPSLFESDVGTAGVVCSDCNQAFSVYVNATISVVAVPSTVVTSAQAPA